LKFIIAHQTVTDGDAVSNDIFGMYYALEEEGHEVKIYCENYFAQRDVDLLTNAEVIKLLKNKDVTMIYHHSVEWEFGNQVIKDCKGKVIIRYHNITPPEFFEPYDSFAFMKTTEGRIQTQHLAINAKGNVIWLSASFYNNNEILDLGVNPDKTFVISPFHQVHELEKVNTNNTFYDIIKNNGKINVFFVGRVAPNKGHKNMIEVAKSFKQLYGEKATFWISGGFDDGLKKYNDEIHGLIENYNVKDIIKFTNKINIEDLKTLFLACDVFLCLSEHEGFCVPLIEAQNFKIPVIALDTSAVAETLGSHQLTYKNFNSEIFAAAINEIANNKEINNFLIENGNANYVSRFAVEKIKNDFINYIKEQVLEET